MNYWEKDQLACKISQDFQPAVTYSKLTIETLEQSVKYVQSYE